MQIIEIQWTIPSHLLENKKTKKKNKEKERKGKKQKLTVPIISKVSEQ